MKFNIITLGCKVNAYESEAIKELLIKEGFINTDDVNDASIVIVNTCSVTNMADNKSKKMIRHVRRENPNSVLVVCGCSSQNNQKLYEQMDIDILIGNKQKSKIVELIKEYIKTNNDYIYFDNNRDLDFESFYVSKFTSQTRAFIKIQDGCNNFCSYCIIPYVRGNIRSKDFKSVISEAKSLVLNNHKEIVLTGIHTGSYFNSGKNIVDLIWELSKIEGLDRIRLSSVEITELNDDFMEMLKKCPKFCNHLHIPLQSGSDNILKRMNRKYDKKYFQEKINTIRSIRKDISITTDIIVGHPYETEEDFLECLKFAREMSFSKIHCFPYSKRDGTAAASMLNQVDESVKKLRNKKLIELSNELEYEYLKKFINKEVNVLIETIVNNESAGHTDNYLEVKVNKALKQNSIYKVKIIKVENNIAYANLV